MKRQPRQPRLARVPDIFLPAALALSAGPEPAGALSLYVAALAVAACSLFASRSARLAFARQPAIRSVRGSVKVALLLTLLGGAILCVLWAALFKAWRPDAPVWIAAGCFLNIEHIFYEYMYAIGDRRSASLSRGLTALFALTGVLLAQTQPAFLVVMTGLAALVSAVVSLVMGDGARGKPNAAVLRLSPRAAVQTLLYPTAAAALVFFAHLDARPSAFFVGLTLFEGCRTPFRRSPQEARSLHRTLMIACSAAVLIGLAAELAVNAPERTKIAAVRCLEGIPAASILLLTAALCLIVLFGNVSKNTDE